VKGQVAVHRPRDLKAQRALLDAGDRAAWRDLLVGLQDRDPGSITVFVDWMRPRLVGRFGRKGVSEADAECMAQDVLLSFIYRYADRIEHPQAMDAYLRLMSATRLRRHWRDVGRETGLPAPEETIPMTAPEREPGTGIDRRRLAGCLSRLTTRIRARLQKHFHLGLGYAEIGRSEGCSGQAARQSIVAALATLRACMEVEG